MAEGPDKSYCLIGAQSILKRLAAFLRPIGGVRKGRDVKFVHRMRVASRRLRNALAMFETCLPRKKRRAWLRRIRDVTRALGAVRDIDVQVQSVGDFLAKTPERSAHAGLERLMLRLRQQRANLQAGVLKALGRLDESAAVGQLEQFCRQARSDSKKAGVRADSTQVRQETQRVIAARLAGLLEFQRCVSRPERAEELHRMRIAARHLRYTLEIFSKLYGGKLHDAIKAARQIQAGLGGIHDCDVWIAFLPVFLEQEQARTREYFGHAGAMRKLVEGINLFRRHKKRRRRKLYEKFVAHWNGMARRDVWGRLLETLRPQQEAVQ
ncbi:MAG: CHAD domain-containing protein [Planctomycetes bacterium]|nr:CHAD domain-containing protein [Planctomycetota bacterium]